MSDLPSRRSGARPTLGDRVRQAVPVLVGLGFGYALGAALDIVLPGSVPVVLWVLAAGPDAPPPRPPILRGPPLGGQLLGWVAGLAVWRAFQVGPVGVLLWAAAVAPPTRAPDPDGTPRAVRSAATGRADGTGRAVLVCSPCSAPSRCRSPERYPRRGRRSRAVIGGGDRGRESGAEATPVTGVG